MNWTIIRIPILDCIPGASDLGIEEFPLLLEISPLTSCADGTPFLLSDPLVAEAEFALRSCPTVCVPGNAVVADPDSLRIFLLARTSFQDAGQGTDDCRFDCLHFARGNLDGREAAS